VEEEEKGSIRHAGVELETEDVESRSKLRLTYALSRGKRVNSLGMAWEKKTNRWAENGWYPGMDKGK